MEHMTFGAQHRRRLMDLLEDFRAVQILAAVFVKEHGLILGGSGMERMNRQSQASAQAGQLGNIGVFVFAAGLQKDFHCFAAHGGDVD